MSKSEKIWQKSQEILYCFDSLPQGDASPLSPFLRSFLHFFCTVFGLFSAFFWAVFFCADSQLSCLTNVCDEQSGQLFINSHSDWTWVIMMMTSGSTWWIGWITVGEVRYRTPYGGLRSSSSVEWMINEGRRGCRQMYKRHGQKEPQHRQQSGKMCQINV